MNWADVMTGLTHTRMRLYDALLGVGRAQPVPSGTEPQAAMRWLCAHHFVVEEDDGLFRARPVAVARECMERAGGPLMKYLQEQPGEAGGVVGPPVAQQVAPASIPARAVPEVPRTHDHQIQFFPDL